MPTIIDSLLVQLGIDDSQFKKGKANLQKGLKEMAKDGEESFASVTKAAVKFFAVLGGTYEIKRFIENQIQANAALQRFSQNLDESANKVSQWSTAAELAGGSVQGLEGSLDSLSQAQTDMKLRGESSLIPYLSMLGVSMTDLSGKALPVTQFLENIGAGLRNLEARTDRRTAFNVGREMGIDPGTLNLLLENNKELLATIKLVKEHTAVTDAQAQEAVKLNVAMTSVGKNFEAFGRELLQDVTPAIEKVFGIMYKFADWCRENKQLVEDFLTIIAAGLTAIAVAASPISLTVIALIALAAALALVWQDYQVWKEGGNSAFNWAPAVNATVTAFRILVSVIESALYRLFHFGEVLGYLAKGDWTDAAAAAVDVVRGKPDGGTKSDRDAFIAAASEKLGVPPEAIGAQLLLETGPRGSKTLGKYNYGNIKAGAGYKGSTVTADVGESTSSGQRYTERSQFRNYSSPQEAAEDYASMIKNKFPGAIGAKTATDFASGLQAGGYATDPLYVNKISHIAAGISNASRAAQGASARNNVTTNSGGNKSVSTSIGEINVNAPNATDAAGISKDMGNSMNVLFTSQANYGLQ